MAEGFLFDGGSVRRISRAVKGFESLGISLDAQLAATRYTRLSWFPAEITGESSDGGLYSWKMVRPKDDATGYEDYLDINEETLTGTENALELNGRIHIPSGTKVRIYWFAQDEDSEEDDNEFFIFELDSLPKFLAKITGHATLGTASGVIYSWKYAWSEVELNGDGSQVVTGGRSGTTSTDYAINLREMGHDEQYQWGVDVDAADYPATFAARAVGGAGSTDAHAVDVVVEMTETYDINGNTKYYFSAMGSHDGSC